MKQLNCSGMERVHMVGEDEDDLYSDFNEYNPTLDTQELEYDPAFQQAVRTSHGRRPPPTAARLAVGNQVAGGRKGLLVPPSSMGMRPITGAQDGGSVRPMTAVRAAGFQSGNKGGAFDPLNQSIKGPAPALEQKNEDTPEEKVKQLERAVNKLIEDSCMASSRGEFQLALEKAKEARRKERAMVDIKQRLLPNNEHVNLDLTYSVLFNLANQLAANNMDNEAMNSYQMIVKNKTFSNAGRLKVNMGNIYFKQRQFDKAVRYYKMALDQVPNTHRNMKTKIKQNVCIAYVKLGQYADAITVLEHIMDDDPNFRTGFNLILCYFAQGDRDMMKRTFERLLTVDLKVDDDEKYVAASDDKQFTLIVEVIKNDSLRQIEREKKAEAEQCIMMAAKIIAPAIDSTYTAGYDWCIEQVKASSYMDLAHNLDIDKAIGFLKQKDFQQAIETLKSFEKKDTKVAAAAATNLSFLYNLEGELSQADKYAEVALQADRYNPSALVNKGNVLFNKGDFEKAREFYHEALQNDSSCVEGLYNFGLANKKLRLYEESLESFYKLHNILRSNAQVMFQLADLHALTGETGQAKEWLMHVNSVVPSDAVIIRRLGEMCDSEGDKIQSLHYHTESYKFDPTNISVLEWLGGYYVESQVPENAVQYFERGAIIQPGHVRWQLMVASCYRRAGNYQQALDIYKLIHRRFPDNIECLKILTKFCVDMNLKEAGDYADKLKKAEKSQQLRDERTSSGRQRSGKKRSEVDGGERQLSGQAKNERRPVNLNEGARGPYQMSSKQPESDGAYSDPLGPQMERPRTAARRRDQPVTDDFEDEDIGDDLLPD